MKKHFIILSILGLSINLFAQNSMTLEQCIEYAFQNHTNVKNAELDYESSKAKVGETRAVGLPQINGKWDVMDNISIQKQFVTANTFNPFAPEDSIMSFGFGLNYSSNMNVTISQLIFDASYIMGLKAANTYKDLYKSGVDKSKTDLAESVSKAYYLVLITNERSKQLSENEKLLEQLLIDTKGLSEVGMVDNIDLKRTKVNLNNIKVELQKISSLQEVSINLLKYQIGMPLTENLELSENLDAVLVEETSQQVNYENNVDYKMLGVQQELNSINLQNEKLRFLPNLGAFWSMGINYGTNTFGDVFKFDNYKSYSMVGASLNVPIFSSGQRKYRIDQARIDLEKTNNNIEFLKQSIDVQVDQQSKNLNNNLEVLKARKENLDLAQEVYDQMKIKYDNGMSSNFEVLSSQTDLRTAQTDYYSALYDALVSKIELDKVSGNLYNE